jgi:hypothetical protein
MKQSNNKQVRLSENQLHRIIKESVKRVLGESHQRTYRGRRLFEEKDTAILDVKRDAESDLKKARNILFNYHIDVPLNLNFGRNEDGYMVCSVYIDGGMINNAKEEDIICQVMEACNFELVYGKAFGGPYFEYNDDRLEDMYGKHNERVDKRLKDLDIEYDKIVNNRNY